MPPKNYSKQKLSEISRSVLTTDKIQALSCDYTFKILTTVFHVVGQDQDKELKQGHQPQSKQTVSIMQKAFTRSFNNMTIRICHSHQKFHTSVYKIWQYHSKSDVLFTLLESSFGQTCKFFSCNKTVSPKKKL